MLLLFDITRGVDVGTKHDIYQLVVNLAAEGKALLYYSSETEEIAQLCHRVLVMREGRVISELSGRKRMRRLSSPPRCARAINE